MHGASFCKRFMRVTRFKQFKKARYLETSETELLLSKLGIAYDEKQRPLTAAERQSGLTVPLIVFHEAVMNDLQKSIALGDARRLSLLLLEWAKYRDSAFVDFVMLELAQLGASPPPMFWQILIFTARRRFRQNSYLGNSRAVEKEIARDEVLNLVSQMRWCGLTLQVASSKAAYWLLGNFPEHRIKASTLDQVYASERMTPGSFGELSQEKILFAAWDRRLGEDEKARLRKKFDDFPEADGVLKGTRRE